MAIQSSFIDSPIVGDSYTPDSLSPIDIPKPTKLEEKTVSIKNKTTDKADKLGFNRVVAIDGNPHDGDTWQVIGDKESTRALGIDAYEVGQSPKRAESILGQKQMARQRMALSAQLSRPATDEDVFNAGKQQQATFQSALGGVTDENGNVLPALVASTDTGMKDYYGKRNLNAIQTLNGKQTLDDGTEVDNSFSVGRITDETAPLVYSPPTNSNEDMNVVESAARSLGGGFISTAAAISDAPSTLYQFLGGDYLEGDGTYDTVVRNVIDTMHEGANVLKDFNQKNVDTNPANREKLVDDFVDAYKDNEGFVNVTKAAVMNVIDNPQGALELGLSSYGFTKALGANGISKIPGFAGAYFDTIGGMATEYKKSTGQDPDDERKKTIALLGLSSTMVDTAAAGYIFRQGGGGKVAEGIGEILKKATAVLPANMRPIIQKVSVGLADLGVEGLQEGTQEGLEQYGVHDKIVDESKIFAAGASGAVSVPGMRAVDVAAKVGSIAASDTSKLKDTLTEKISTISKKKESKLSASQEKTSKSLDTVVTKIKDLPVASLAKAMDMVAVIDTEGNKELEAKKQKTVKDISKRLATEKIDAKELKLGSEEDAVLFIEEVLANTDTKDIDSTTLDENIKSIADAHNISEEKLQIIKDSATVEREATTGVRGYKTYDRTLSRLNKDPKRNSKAIEKVTLQLEHFQNTQIDRLDRLQKAVNTIKANIKSGTQTETKVKVPYANRGEFTIHVANGKVNDATYKVMKDIQRTIDGIQEVMDKQGITAQSTDTKEPVRVLKGTGEKRIFQAANAINPSIKAKEPVFMDILTKRDAVEKAMARHLTKENYVEVDTEGVIKYGTGRWVYADNATKGAPTVKEVADKIAKGETLTSEDEQVQSNEKAKVETELQKKKVILDYHDLVEELKYIEKDITLAKEHGTNDDYLAELEVERDELLDKKADILTKDVSNAILKTANGNGREPLKADKDGYEQSLNINDYVEVRKGDSSLLASIYAEDLGGKTGTLLKKAIDLIKKTIPAVNNESSGYKGRSKEDYYLVDSPSRMLIYDAEGNINSNVAIALQVGLSEYLSLGASNLLSKNREQIAAMMGIQESDVNKEATNFFKDKGVYTKNAANDIGKAVLKSLGFKANENIPRELYAKLIADLGHVAIIMGTESGNIEFTTTRKKNELTDKWETTEGVSLMEHNMLVFGNPNGAVNGKTISFIRFTEKGKSNMDKHSDTFTALQDELGIESKFQKGPRRKPTVTDDVSIRNNDITEQSPKAKVVLDKFRNTKFIKINNTIEWLAKNTDMAKEYLGYKTDDDMSTMSFQRAESAVAKNEEIDRSLENLEELEYDNMYFDWFYSRNGRYMLDSNMVNPQTDKLHRFSVIPVDHEVELDINDAEQERIYNTALAQAFGMSTDKKPTDEVQKFGNTVRKIGSKKLLQMLETGEFKKDIEVEHLSHYLQGVWSLQALEASKDGKFNSNLSMESDAVTSGLGLKLLQFPILGNKESIEDQQEQVMKWARKTGLFVNEEVSSMNDEVSKYDFSDGYETLAQEVSPDEIKEENYQDTIGKTGTTQWEALNEWSDVHGLLEQFKSILPKPEIGENGESKVSKELRTLFKDPFMTFNYSRGTASIKKGLGFIIAEELIETFAQGDMTKEQKALYIKLNKIYGEDVKSLKTLVKTKEPSKIFPKNYKKNSKSLIDYLAGMGSATYGHLAVKALDKHFGEFSKANDVINESFADIFIEYNKEYIKAVDKVEITNKRGITEKENIEIIQSLRATFPLIKGPYSEGLEDSIAIVDSTTSVPDYSYQSARTRIKPGVDDKKQRKSVQSKIRTLVAAVKSGSVIPIHYIDGAVMGNTVADSKGILGVHDAIIGILTNLIPDVKNYNKNIIEVNKAYSVIDELVASVEMVYKGKDKPESYESLIGLQKRVTAMREWLFNQNIDVVHMSAVDGSKYSYKGNKVETPKKEYNTTTESTLTAEQITALKDVLFTKAGSIRVAVKKYAKDLNLEDC